MHAKAQLQTDSVKKLNSVSAAGNYLASKGTLKIKVQDSTYTFDASQDSVAFINETINGKQYFGVTAINKAHTVSFGISSSAPIADMYGTVAWAQFLMHVAGKANIEYTLTHNAPPRDYGSIKIEKYKRDTILAIGTFHTYLAKDSKPSSPFFIADGSFDLEGK
ncbi:MAG: hypothetical protein ABI166_03000 [Mucilaginibacter sp.]